MSNQLLPDYSGKYVRLTEERMNHILMHPEMRDLMGKIAEVLISPEQVIASNTDKQTALYYREYRTELFGQKWLCVVVKNVASDPFVLTAYLTDSIKKGTVLWQAK